MGKVVKKAAGFLLSAALVVGGFLTANPALVAAGISMAVTSTVSLAVSLFTKSPQVSQAQEGRLYATVDPDTPRKIVFGRTAMATDVRYQEYTGSNQEYYHQIVAVASHKVEAIEELWLEDKKVWTASGGVTGSAVGYLTVAARLEGSASNTVAISSNWGASRRLTGCAYLHLRFKLTGNSKKAESPYAGGVPQRMTIVGKGAWLYDPRRDSTVGGSGTMRADDQATWGWAPGGVEIGRNPPLQELFYLLGWRINGKLAVGRGVLPSRIDMASYIAAANACDEAVTKAAGGTEPRYRCDGVFSEGDPPSLVFDNLEASCNAVRRDVGGRIGLTVIANDLGAPIASFTADHVIGGFSWDQTGSIEETFNIVRGRYTDPSPNALYQPVDYPAVRIASLDGIDRPRPIDLLTVQSPSQAQRLVKQSVQRSLYRGMFSAEFNAMGWGVQLGDVVRLTFPALGFSNKLFRVIEHTIKPDGIVPMTLLEEHASIYAWDAEEGAAVTAAAPIEYNPLNDPLIASLLRRNVFRQATDPALVIENGVVDGDTWIDTSIMPQVERVRVEGLWQAAANLVTDTGHITDGAGLGDTATWLGVTDIPAPLTDGRVDLALSPAGDVRRPLPQLVRDASSLLSLDAGGDAAYRFTGDLDASRGALPGSLVGGALVEVVVDGAERAAAGLDETGRLEPAYNNMDRIADSATRVGMQPVERTRLTGIEDGANRSIAGRAINDNSAFEDWVGGAATGWFQNTSGVSVTLLANSVYSTRGPNAARLPSGANFYNSRLVPVTPGETAWVSYGYQTIVNRTGGASPLVTIGINFFDRAGGFVFAPTSYAFIDRALPVAEGRVQGVFPITVPAGAYRAAPVTAIDSGAGFTTSGSAGALDYLELFRDEPGSDVTPDLIVPAAIDIAADAQGVVTTPLPLTRRLRAMKGNLDVSATTPFTVVLPPTLTGSVNNTPGPDRGVLTITAATGAGEISAEAATTPKATRKIPVRFNRSAVTQAGGSAGASVSDNSWLEAIYETHAAISDDLTIAANAAGELRFAASSDHQSIGATGENVAIKAVIVIGGVPTDVQAETVGVASVVSEGAINPGSVTMAEVVKTGLTPDASYVVRLMGRRTTAGSSSFFNSSFVARQ